MTTSRELSPSGETIASLVVQVTALRGQVRAINETLHRAGLTDGVNLAEKYQDLTRAVTAALGKPPHGPAAPYWLDLDPETRTTQLDELTQWATTVLRTQYDGYQLPACWANHPQAIWELSTLAAEWDRTYSRPHPDLDRALEFHDRWLPGTMRRVTDITRRCNPECVTTQRQPWQPPHTRPGTPRP
jgi:hypothetical protein